MTETTVVVDTHEPDAIRMLALDHPDVDDWIENELAAADLIVNGVGFERKTPSDFAASITEGRMVEQVQKLRDAYDNAYVLLEGGFEDFDHLEHSGLNPYSARGMAASLTARHSILTVPTGHGVNGEQTRKYLVDYAVRLGRKHTEDPVSSHIPTGDVGEDHPPGKRMWACLPNIGPTLADSLWHYFGSPGHFTATVEDMEGVLTRISGIGEKTAQRVTEELVRYDE